MIAALLGCAGCLGTGADDAARAPAPPSLSFDDLHLTQFRGATPILRLDAHRLRIVPWQVGVLRMGPLHRALLARVRCELLETRAASAAASPALAVLRPDRFAFGAAATVASVTLDDVECTVVRDGEPVARVRASRADPAGTSGTLLLRQLVVERLPAGPVLTADRGTWDPDQDAIAIRGPWALSDRAGVRRGRGLRIDVELRRPELSQP